uniref:Nucleolar complex-associated protein 3 N-terminal domain-containing protein n=1 Tax=Panagrolaimus sp. PS1159 TaxID=55785 RepID=A0AC35FYQ6_9BILA
MNGQQPNHSGMSGYGMTPQQQQAMMQQHQYSRMLNQQQQQQQSLPQQPTLPQQTQQSMYSQNFYQQGYIQNIQIQAHGLLSNSHINNQQMALPPQQQQQFYAAQQQFQQQTPQDSLPQTQHHLQQQQVQYNPQAIYQQEHLSHQQHIPQSQPQRRQPTESMHHLSQNPSHQSAFSQPLPQQSQQQSSHSAIVSQQHPSMPPPQIIQEPSHQQPPQQQHVIHHPKPTKPSPAKEAENSALHNEMIRKQRIAEEKQKQIEREKRETQKIQDEINSRQKQADLYAKDVQERLDQFKNPILFAGCHLTTNLTKILPFPRENVSPEDIPCHNPTSCAEYLRREDPDLVGYICAEYLRREDPDLVGYMSTLLLNSFDDVKDLNVKHNEIEANIYDGNELPPLMKNVHSINQYSFHIQTEFDDITLDPELAKAVAEVVNTVNPQQEEGEAATAAKISEEMAAKKSPPQPKPISKPVNTTGKEPKGKEKAFGNSRRKKNEVGELVDSLTPYYDVSGDRSRKRKHGSARPDSASDEENQPQPSTSDGPKFFNKTKKIKKVKREDEPERPPTPTEVIKQRELEWAERERNLQDKNRRRQQQAEAEGLCVMAESESQNKVDSLLEKICDNSGSSSLIEKNILCELRKEAQKLKNWRKLHKCDGDRLAKLVQMLEKNIRDVIDEEGQLICKDLLESDDIANEMARELLNERFVRASDGATLALVIMTSHRAPKQAMIEDTIERSAQLCKQLLAHVVFPAADSIVRNSKGKKLDEKPKKRKGAGDFASSWNYDINLRVVDMIECFSELIRNYSLNEVTVALLSTMASTPFFVDGIGQIQMASIQLLSVIFRKYETFRHDIMKELLFSIHQLPPAKNLKNCYRLSSNEYVHNFTVLILQLIQSVVIIPARKRSDDGDDEKPTDEDDTFIDGCFKEAKKWAVTFLKSFLHKCTAKAEEDYRRKFELFLQDLLAALYRPDWPAAELMLTVLGSILVTTFRAKTFDISLRIASMDYLGTITARLRKDRVITGKDSNFDKTRLEMVVKSILFDEANDSTALLDDVDISKLSSTEKMQKLQQALIDFLIATKSDNDVSAEYAIAFYAGEWYKKTVDDLELSQQQHQDLQSQNLSSSEMKKAEKRYQRIVERSENMKEFLIKLADKKNLKKRGTHVAKSGRIMIDSDAAWTDHLQGYFHRQLLYHRFYLHGDQYHHLIHRRPLP